jgi:predicted Zn finger-like uncharacterized protein
MKIYTQCSHCETVFAVTETQMAHKSGWVRCGHCKEPFNAYAQRLSDPVEAESFIDVDAELASSGSTGVRVDDAGNPEVEPPGPEGNRDVYEGQPWTNFELTLDRDEDDFWEDDEGVEDEDGADEDNQPVEQAALDLDMTVFEGDDSPPTGLADPTPEELPNSAKHDSKQVATAADGAPKLGETVTLKGDATPDNGDSHDEEGQDEEVTLASDAMTADEELMQAGASNAEDEAGLDGMRDASTRSRVQPGGRVVRSFVDARKASEESEELTHEQEITIDPVFTVDETDFDFAQKKKTHVSWGRVSTAIFFTLVLSALVVWQLTLRYWDTWNQNMSFRPALTQWCFVASCTVPPLRDIRMVDLVGTSIATHDEVAGALQVTIQLINRAEFSQAYPSLEISLTDREGEVVGRRTLQPREFLGIGRGESNLASRHLTSIVLDLADPPDAAVGYEVRIIDI